MPVLTIRAGSPLGALADGTAYYAPIGEVIVDGALVTCHLCGRSLRSVTAHLRAHGWTKLAYCEAFGLERGQSLEGPETRKLRAVALASRLVFEPAMRQGRAAGRGRARTGALARDAARAATGRGMPEQRRRKAAAALAAVPPPLVARANRDRAARHLACVAADVPSYLRERHIVQHWTVNAIAAEAGLAHYTVKAALRRHGVARVAHAARRHAASQRAAQVAGRLGFDTMPGYVADRRAAGWTWAAMAAECAQPSSWLRRQARPGSPHQPQETMPNGLRAATWPAHDPPPVASVPLRGGPRL